MLVYTAIAFGIGGIFLILGIQISRGKTDLIHYYHQKKVKDKLAYGKDFAKGMYLMALGHFASGIAGLLGDSQSFAIAAVVVQITGILAGLAWIFWVQKKHNQGIF